MYLISIYILIGLLNWSKLQRSDIQVFGELTFALTGLSDWDMVQNQVF